MVEIHTPLLNFAYQKLKEFALAVIQIGQAFAVAMERDVKYLLPSINSVGDSTFFTYEGAAIRLQQEPSAFMSTGGGASCEVVKLEIPEIEYYKFFMNQICKDSAIGGHGRAEGLETLFGKWFLFCDTTAQRQRQP